jgi:hypothetical protein
MATILTYHDSDQNGRHWFKSVAYGKDQIEKIKDPAGGDTRQLPTSIPSPFARFDLVRTAFANLVLKGILNGTPNDQRLVSDAFDIGELFFNYEKLKSSLKIVAWSKETDLAILLKSPSNKKHERLGKAYNLYLDQASDKETYHFDKIKRIAILLYKGEVVGGTSPSTVFFSSGNNLSNLNIMFGGRKFFDRTKPQPLYLRDIEYQKFWYCLMQQPNFRAYFRELYDYLDASKNLLKETNVDLYEAHIASSNNDSLVSSEYNVQNYLLLDTGQVNDNVEILGMDLWKNKIQTSIQSDFKIDSSKYKGEMPLALQNNFRRSLNYVTGVWNADAIKVPHHAKESWRDNKRQLLNEGFYYPWLTTSDFLEPYLVRVPFQLNEACFFTGYNTAKENRKGYLLPLTKDFFEFFDAEDLTNGKVRFEITPSSLGVRVTLQIPIKGAAKSTLKEYITYEREYVLLDTEPNLTENEGAIVEHTFMLSIFPFVKADSEEALPPDYRVQIIEDTSKRGENVAVNYIGRNNSEPLTTIRRYRTQATGGEFMSSKFDIIKSNFDYIQTILSTNFGVVNATIVPIWPKYQSGGDAYTFAVDFGTTNSHIEYRVKEGGTKPFETVKSPVAVLANPSFLEKAGDDIPFIYRLFDWEFVPITIGDKSAYSLPFRTVLAAKKQLNYNTAVFTLADMNVPFFYERKPTHDATDDYIPNLKWAKESEAEKNVKAYLEELLFLMRSKVVLEGGDFTKTRIVWFYPSSMTPKRRTDLGKIWEDLFKITFVGVPLSQIAYTSESIAPYYHHTKIKRLPTAGTRPLVNIDIGGGTTDVVIYEKNKPQKLTSFRFAGNALFGDGFGDLASDQNGFVMKYKDQIAKRLEDNGYSELLKIHKQVCDTKRSTDIISFWFSTERNPNVSNREDLSFSNMLAKDEYFGIVFLFFYTAILYHVAQMMKKLVFDKPRYISFSGSGSKMLNIISNDDATLAQFAKLVFEEVYQSTFDRDGVSITRDREHPKEATCKGGLMMTPDELSVRPEDIAYIYTASYQNEYDDLTYEDAQKPDITQSIVTEAEAFLQFFFNLNKKMRFGNYFEVSNESIQWAKDILSRDLGAYLGEGLEQKKQEIASLDEPIEETLFFYPFIGTLNNLVYEIGQRTM